MLSRTLKYNFGFNIESAFRGIKAAIRAPIKHIKAALEPTGINNSIQLNLTAESFDEVAHQWQAHLGRNPFDLHTFNYFESTQLTNFGTIDNPNVVFSADAPFRFIGCSGLQNEDDYEGHELLWMMLREGPLQRCYVCGQVFKLVRLRNEFSSEMDYYMNDFSQLWWQDMNENEVVNNLSFLKANTHFESTSFENPEDGVFSHIGPDEHDRVLTDPAYRMQKNAEATMKAKVYELAMKDYEEEKWANKSFREPMNKKDYENLIEAEAIIKKLDRHFRKLTKFHSRKFVDPINHARREKRMLERSNKRWDNSYTIFTNDLTEQEQKYRDYFETDLQNYREDEVLEEYLDKQELIADPRYNLHKYDFQEMYTHNPEDDQTSYIEKKIFKFKYRRALDTQQDYERRNKRMIEGQKARFQQKNANGILQRFVQNRSQNQNEYIQLVSDEAVHQYNDYFQSENDEFDNIIFNLNKDKFALAFENWQLEKRDRSTYQTFPLPQWNNELGFWANAIQVVKEASTVSNKLDEIQEVKQAAELSTTNIEKKN